MEAQLRTVARGAASGASWFEQHTEGTAVLKTYESTLAVFDARKAQTLSTELKKVHEVVTKTDCVQKGKARRQWDLCP